MDRIAKYIVLLGCGLGLGLGTVAVADSGSPAHSSSAADARIVRELRTANQRLARIADVTTRMGEALDGYDPAGSNFPTLPVPIHKLLERICTNTSTGSGSLAYIGQ